MTSKAFQLSENFGSVTFDNFQQHLLWNYAPSPGLNTFELGSRRSTQDVTNYGKGRTEINGTAIEYTRPETRTFFWLWLERYPLAADATL